MTRKKKLEQIENTLKEGVSTFICTDRYKELLTIWSRFHKYSARNILLIAIQMPDASYIAGYNTWKTKFNRVPAKGSHALTVLAPCPIKIVDDDTEEQKELLLFKPANVFDISQTIPIPGTEDQQVSFNIKELQGSVPDFTVILNAISSISPVPITFEEIHGETKGYYSPIEKRIAIKTGMSELATIKTALHELFHATAHSSNKDGTLCNTPRDVMEIQAESGAFMIASLLNLDVSEYSFEYISGWNEYKEDIKTLSTSMTVIRDISNSIYEKIMNYIQKADLAS